MWVLKVNQRMPKWARKMEIRIMTKIDEKVAELSGIMAETASSVSGLEGDIATLDAKIEALQAAIASGDMTPEQEAAMQAVIDAAKNVRDRVTALDALTPAASTPEPPPADTPADQPA